MTSHCAKQTVAAPEASPAQSTLSQAVLAWLTQTTVSAACQAHAARDRQLGSLPEAAKAALRRPGQGASQGSQIPGLRLPFRGRGRSASRGVARSAKDPHFGGRKPRLLPNQRAQDRARRRPACGLRNSGRKELHPPSGAAGSQEHPRPARQATRAELKEAPAWWAPAAAAPGRSLQPRRPCQKSVRPSPRAREPPRPPPQGLPAAAAAHSHRGGGGSLPPPRAAQAPSEGRGAAGSASPREPAPRPPGADGAPPPYLSARRSRHDGYECL